MIQVGCGQQTKSISFTSADQMANCLSESGVSTGCAVDTATLDAKIADANAAVVAVDDVMTQVEPGRIISDPSKLLSNKSIQDFLSKIKDLTLKIDQISAEVDKYLGTLDPVKQADLVAKLQKIKDRLLRIESDIKNARDRLVAKLDEVTAKIQQQVDKLDPVVRLVLDSKISKLFKFLANLRKDLLALI